MKIIFSDLSAYPYLADRERLIFQFGSEFYDEHGNKVPAEDSLYEDEAETDEDGWDEELASRSGLAESLLPESAVEPEYDSGDMFGNFGFQNRAGVFVIEPQYAYAYNFTHGLAAVNLNRTWFRTEDGRRFYENHYGYIDGAGKTVIGFQYDEAYPFNRYGVALVSDLKDGWHLIDLQGNEIPGTRFPYISRFDYNERFVEFSSDDADNAPLGVYDTKERKILLEPSNDGIIEFNEEVVLVYMRDGEHGRSDFHQHYINSKGEILYPWLYGKDFAIVEIPDSNSVTAVAYAHFREVTGKQTPWVEGDGKRYERTFWYGLYSSKGEFLLPAEYKSISKIADCVWCCEKDGLFTVVKTEPGD